MGLSLPSGRICALPQAFLPGHRFYSVKSSVYEKQNFSFSVKKTKRKPVDASGRRRLEDPAGRSPRKLEIPPRQAGWKRSVSPGINSEF
jgi:hypothetical protein